MRGQSKSYRDRIWSLESQWFNIRQAISPTSQWLAGQPAAMSSHSLQERWPLSPAGERRRWLRISQWPMWIKHPFMIMKYASPVSPCRFKAPVSPSVGYNPVEVFLNFHTSPATFWAPLLIFCTACSKCPPPSLNSGTTRSSVYALLSVKPQDAFIVHQHHHPVLQKHSLSVKSDVFSGLHFLVIEWQKEVSIAVRGTEAKAKTQEIVLKWFSTFYTPNA